MTWADIDEAIHYLCKLVSQRVLTLVHIFSLSDNKSCPVFSSSAKIRGRCLELIRACVKIFWNLAIFSPYILTHFLCTRVYVSVYCEARRRLSIERYWVCVFR